MKGGCYSRVLKFVELRIVWVDTGVILFVVGKHLYLPLQRQVLD